MSVFPLQALFGKGMGWSSFFQKRGKERSLWAGEPWAWYARVEFVQVMCCKDVWKIQSRYTCWIAVTWGWNRNQNVLILIQCLSNASYMPGMVLSSGKMTVIKTWSRPSQGSHILGQCCLIVTCVRFTLGKWRLPSLCQRIRISGNIQLRICIFNTLRLDSFACQDLGNAGLVPQQRMSMNKY